jgi:hypothetical protein
MRLAEQRTATSAEKVLHLVEPKKLSLEFEPNVIIGTESSSVFATSP